MREFEWELFTAHGTVILDGDSKDRGKKFRGFFRSSVAQFQVPEIGQTRIEEACGK